MSTLTSKPVSNCLSKRPYLRPRPERRMKFTGAICVEINKPTYPMSEFQTPGVSVRDIQTSAFRRIIKSTFLSCSAPYGAATAKVSVAADRMRPGQRRIYSVQSTAKYLAFDPVHCVVCEFRRARGRGVEVLVQQGPEEDIEKLWSSTRQEEVAELARSLFSTLPEERLKELLELRKDHLARATSESAAPLLELYYRAKVADLGENLDYWIRHGSTETVAVAASISRGVSLSPAERQKIANSLEHVLEGRGRVKSSYILLNETVRSLTLLSDELGLARLRERLPALGASATSVAYDALTYRIRKEGAALPRNEVTAWNERALTATKDYVERDTLPLWELSKHLTPLMKFMSVADPESAASEIAAAVTDAYRKGYKDLVAVGVSILRELTASPELGKLIEGTFAKTPGITFNLLMKSLS